MKIRIVKGEIQAVGASNLSWLVTFSPMIFVTGLAITLIILMGIVWF